MSENRLPIELAIATANAVPMAPDAPSTQTRRPFQSSAKSGWLRGFKSDIRQGSLAFHEGKSDLAQVKPPFRHG